MRKSVLIVVILFAILLALWISKNKATVSPSVTPTVEPSPSPTSEANIHVFEPVANQVIGLPLIIKGEARVFENTLNWRLRDSDSSILVEGRAMAAAPDVGEFGAFAVSVLYPEPQGPTGKLEVFDYSAKDGSEIDLVTVPIRFVLPTPFSGETTTVKAYFYVDDQLSSVDRIIPKTDSPAAAAIQEILRGPTTDEKNQGFYSNVSSEAQVQKLTIQSGTAQIDFNEKLDSATTCRSAQAIVNQITQTLKQFSSVKKVVITVNGKSAQDALFHPWFNDTCQP